MKLSEIKGERLLVTIAECVEPLGRIMEDEKVLELFKRRELPEGEDPSAFTVKRIVKALPALFGDHAKDLTVILGTIASNTPEGVASGMTVERYAEEGNYLADVRDLLADKDFIGFLALQ